MNNGLLQKVIKRTYFFAVVVLFFLAGNSFSQPLQYLKQFGSTEATAYSVSVDSCGYFYVSGVTGIVLPGQTKQGGYDAYYRKYNSAGNEIQTNEFGIPSVLNSLSYDSAYNHGVYVDAAGNVYMTGYTYHSVTLPSYSSDEDAYIRKYNAAGTIVWTKRFVTGSKNEQLEKITTDSSGNIYVSGYSGYPSNAVLRKYSSSGDQVWVEEFISANNTFTDAQDLTVDGTGNVWICGYTGGALSGQTAIGGNDSFIRKYSSAGSLGFTKQFGTALDDQANGITADPSGNIFVCGFASGTLSGQASSGKLDAYVKKYDTSGNELWTKQFGTSGDDSAYDVSVDSSGNVFVCGWTEGTLTGQTNSGNYDAFVREYDPAGNVLWTKQFGTADYDIARGIKVNSYGDIFVCGSVNVNLNEIMYTGPANCSAFFARFGSLHISGYVKDSSNNSVSGVTLSLTGTASKTATTDASGYYEFLGLSTGQYSVAASKTNYSFSPLSKSTDSLKGDIYNHNFTATSLASAVAAKYDLKGYVKDAAGTGISGAAVSLSGKAAASYTTAANGYYEFLSLSTGSYTVMPSNTGYTFDPVSKSTSSLSANVSNWNFTGTLDSSSGNTVQYYYIKGYIKDSAGNAISGVLVSLSGTAEKFTSTDANGYYEFTNLATGNYTITPSKSGYSCNPASLSYTGLSVNQENQNLTGIEIKITAPKGEVKIQGGQYGYLDPGKGEAASIAVYPSESGDLSIKVYTLNGQLVWETSKAVSTNVQEIVNWACKNADNEVVASGIYLVHIKGAGLDVKKKVAIVK